MPNYWVVRVGRTIQQKKHNIAEEVMQRGVVGIGWPEVGNIEHLHLYHDVVQLILDTYPSYTTGKARAEASSLHKFVHSVVEDDFVLTPMESPNGSAVIFVGRITDRCRHNHQEREDWRYLLSNTRPVEWLRTDVSWNDLSSGLSASLCANPTVYSVNKHTNEINRVLGMQPPKQSNSDGNPHRRTRSSRNVTPETIAQSDSSGEWDPDERQLFNMRKGVLQQRNAHHQELVRSFARAMGCDAIMEYPFDYGLLTSPGVLLAEMKTLDGTQEDERRQVRAAVGQLFYYERYDEGVFLPPEYKGLDLVKVAVFDKQPSPIHTRWVEGLKIAVVWQDNDGRFASTPESNRLIVRIGLPPFTTEEIA